MKKNGQGNSIDNCDRSYSCTAPAFLLDRTELQENYYIGMPEGMDIDSAKLTSLVGFQRTYLLEKTMRS
ncbi:hypothetical protein I6G82_17585 [Lysinibacillus macroides]|uniref:Uncharacterized protein n=1 Tax=Lysinibacillus macroides TaxID=33935 RepID=A0A0M9DMQ8_9BACI|nr:hypothetical protein [Lysinibacillus macroides]KOY83783.1 hypothetical protein ADM90_02470 [Lysinibacillus macroides]QPR67047.1 hypothetical protein I6G82_17585 [Lysinibacillus macroides]